MSNLHHLAAARSFSGDEAIRSSDVVDDVIFARNGRL